MAALVFSYFDPVRKLVKNNKAIQVLLDNIKAKYGFRDLNEFIKGQEAVKTDQN